MRRPSLRVFALFCAWLACVSADALAVDARSLRQHVEYLSADDLRGRDTGARGIALAERYVARAFADAGLRPLPGQQDHFVDLVLYRRGYDLRATALELRAGEATLDARAGIDYRPFPFSDEGLVRAPLVFAGYGISAPDLAWNDYAELDVEGKLVLVLRHAPGEGNDDSPFSSDSNDHALFETKAKVAAEHGARGMLLVTDPLNHTGADDLRLSGRLSLDPPRARPTPGEEDEPPFLAAQISRELAEQLVRGGGHDLAGLQRAVDGGRLPKDLPLGVASAELSVRMMDEAERVSTRNVVGFLEGRDAELKREWVVIGGHHDHVGAFEGEGDTIFNGADDNASGTAGVIELARWFASRDERPRRSLVFATFTAEERGLLGSRALVEGGMLSREHVVFMLNLDMIGRNPERKIEVFGDGFVKDLRPLVETANAETDLDLEFGGDAYAGNSDHDPFYEADVPFMFIFTGLHEDYHGVGDHAGKLDYRRMQKILRVAAGVIESMAEAPSPPSFIHHVSWLGIEFEVLGEGDDRAVTVTEVEADTRGSAAGLRTGDVIVALDGAVLEPADAAGDAFRAIEPGERTELETLRAGQKLAFEVERAKTGYLGVVPGPVDDTVRSRYGIAEGDGLTVREVRAEGPAAAAGLRAGDVLLQIGGKPVNTMNLRSHLTRIGAGETVEFTILRDGERLSLPVTLGERP